MTKYITNFWGMFLENQLQKNEGFILREKVLNDSKAVVQGVIKHIKDEFDTGTTKYIGVYSKERMFASMRIINYSSNNNLPCLQDYNFSINDIVLPSHTNNTYVEVSRLAVDKEPGVNVIHVLSLVENMLFSLYGPITVVLSLCKNIPVYIKRFRFLFVQEKNGITLLKKNVNCFSNELYMCNNQYYLIEKGTI